MDYETFGEHQWAESGIFEFLKHLPKEVKKYDIGFMNPKEVIRHYEPKDEIDVPFITSWADIERDLSAWLGNKMQESAHDELYSLRELVLKTRDKKIIEDWRKLLTSDHLYYMCTKWFADGDVHKYFNPYDTPYDCFINLMNIINDLIIRAKNKLKIKEKEGDKNV